MAPGQSYGDSIVRCIESCQAFLLIATAKSMESNQVLSEVEQAHKRGIPIYTVMVGRSRVPRELDYYISRLHWIQFAGTDVDGLTGKLISVFSTSKDWSQVATPPSFLRRLQHVSAKLFWSATASTLVLAMAVSVAWVWIERKVDALHRDYRSLGWVTVAADEQPTPRDSTHLQLQVWLVADGARYSDLNLRLSAERATAIIEARDFTALLQPDQVGPMEAIRVRVPQTTDRIVACLSVPSRQLKETFRVIQVFSLRESIEGNGAARIVIAPASEPTVAKETGAPCSLGR
jgi:hypothetical protein